MVEEPVPAQQVQKEESTPTLTHHPEAVKDPKDVNAEVQQVAQTEGELSQELVSAAVHNMLSSVFPIFVELPCGTKVELMVSQGDGLPELRRYISRHPSLVFLTSYSLSLNGHTLYEYGFASPQPSGSEDGIVGDGDHQGQPVEPPPLDPLPTIEPNCVLKAQPLPYSKYTARKHLDNFFTVLHEWQQGEHTLFSSLLFASEVGDEVDASRPLDPKVYEVDSLKADPSSLFPHNSHEAAEGQFIPALQSLTFSGWNPPSSNRQLLGDHFYLDVTTMEGKSYVVTASSHGFFVNQSALKKFSPQPDNRWRVCHELVDLLKLLSVAFCSSITKKLGGMLPRHPFELAEVTLPTNLWVQPVAEPVYHKQYNDIGLSTSVELKPYEDTTSLLLRDWNEDFQVVREMPRSSIDEKIVRDHALARLQSEFVKEATKGVELIFSHAVPPINPFEPFSRQMFIRNKVFYCVISDSELYRDIGGEETAHLTAANDLKGIHAFMSADVDGISTVPTVIVDYCGYRFTAQAIVPGILQVQHSQILYGSFEPGEPAACDADFHDRMKVVAERLLIRPRQLRGKDSEFVEFAGPADIKGIEGTDKRKYVLDLAHIFPRDPLYPETTHHAYILRAELIANYVYHLQEEKRKEKERKKEEESEKRKEEGKAEEKAEEGGKVAEKEEEDFSFEQISIRFNPDLFLNVTFGDPPAEIEKDRSVINDLSKFLVDVTLPRIVDEWISYPQVLGDSVTLREYLRQRGVNMRYLGQLATLCLKKGARTAHYLCVREMFVRSAKTLLNQILKVVYEQTDGRHNAASAVSHFLNCLFGTWIPSSTPAAPASESVEEKKTNGKESEKKDGGKKKKKKPARVVDPSNVFASARRIGCKCSSCTSSHASVWKDVSDRIVNHFKYSFDSTAEGDRKPCGGVASLRALCYSVGLVLNAKDYDFSKPAPFEASDVLSFYPKVKQVPARSQDSIELIESARITLEKGRLDHSLALLSDALHIVHHVFGPLHSQTATCYSLIAALMHHTSNVEQALLNQILSLLIRERVLGEDHEETAHSYASLGLFYLNLGRYKLAFKYFRRALLLSRLSFGASGPAELGLFVNIAMIFQDQKQFAIALYFYEKGYQIAVALEGNNSLSSLEPLHGMAVVSSLLQQFDAAVKHQSECVRIMQTIYGESDARTNQANFWLNQFKAQGERKEAQKSEKIQLTEEQLKELWALLMERQKQMQEQQKSTQSEGEKTDASSAADGKEVKKEEGKEDSKVMYVDAETLSSILDKEKSTFRRGFLLRPPPGGAAPSPAMIARQQQQQQQQQQQAQQQTQPSVASTQERGFNTHASLLNRRRARKAPEVPRPEIPTLSPSEIERMVAEIEGKGEKKVSKNSKKKAKNQKKAAAK